MRVAFYAPLKAPDHPVPSGDRTMARALVKAIAAAGHAVEFVSPLRSFLAAPDAAAQGHLADAATREADRIAALWRDGGPPDLWFTYHNHYKAPDLLGPALTRRFALPYGLAEASHAASRAATWGSWHTAAETATRAADLHVCFTARDREGIAALLDAETAVLDLPPFIDLDGLTGTASEPATRGGPVRLATLAMMRPGDKLASYALLAAALEKLSADPALPTPAWHLDIVGDGDAHPAVTRLFAVLPPERITWHGALDRRAAWQRLGGASLFVWPGIGEAFGLAYLEAQALGLPVLALDVAGVPAVVRHGETGLLVVDPSSAAFADALAGLMSDRDALAQKGGAARRFVTGERTLAQASARLGAALLHCREHKGRNRG